MPEMTKHEPGMFNWADLMTTDMESATAFYTQLLGCDTRDNPIDGGGVYRFLVKNGKTVAGLFQMTPDMTEQGMSPCWNAYVAVASADDAAKKAADLGGVVTPPMDVFDFGRMTSVIDPAGAASAAPGRSPLVLGLWEAKTHIGAELIGEPGAFCWAELYTNDTAAAAEFYTALFGWERQEIQGVGDTHYADSVYHMFTSGGAPAGGMLQIRPEWGEMPSNWTVYFGVESLDAAFEQVKALGGEVRMGPMTVPGIGLIGLVSDPQHAYVMLMQPAARS